MEQATEPKTYQVPEANLSLLAERIAKLNKRAVKLGCPAITLTQPGYHDVPLYKRDFDGSISVVNGQKVIASYRRVFEIQVSGAAPRINGWEFIAVIQPTTDEEGKVLGNLLRNVPGATREVPAQYRSAENNCDHCHTARRRNETFILMNDAGDSQQVGRNCLRDFLGHTSPDAYCAYAELLLSAADLAMGSEDDNFFGGGAAHIDRYLAEEILQLAACSIRLNGWRSNKTAREYGSESTSMEVSAWLSACRRNERKKWQKPLEPSAEDKATAHEVSEWLAALAQRADLNDYLYNLSVLGQGATFRHQNFGLACSAIPTYLREMEREINRRKQFESDKNSQYVGEVGQRSDFLDLTLVYTQDWASDFGVTHFYKFRDASGNIVVWKASAIYFNPTTRQDVNVGDTVNLTATVKKHEEREGIKQTTISRAVEYKSKEQKKAEARERKAQREAEKAEHDANLANNPDFYNAYSPNFGKHIA